MLCESGPWQWCGGWSGSIVQVQMDVVLKDGDQQHDAEAQQHAGVLQQEEATVTEAVVAGVVVQHLGHLRWTGSGEFGYSGPTCAFFFFFYKCFL